MASSKLIAVGDYCLDVYRSIGFLAVGGNALNVAVQWRRRGIDARYFGALGRDGEAEIMMAAIAAAGLDPQDVEIRLGGSAVTLLADERGERRFLFESLGVGEDYVPETGRYEALRLAEWVHLGTNASVDLVRRLVRDKVPFSVDLSTRPLSLPLEGVPLVFASGPDDPEEPLTPLFDALKSAGVRVEVVDTCGAGDSFIASFILARLEGVVAGEALARAAVYASETCTHLGGFPQPISAIPQWLLDKHDRIIRSSQGDSA
ncbi:MAG: fructoselysine 6-kinase [Alphaproteobacteria bacterium PA3]|nr:MAG: fructoselysine 6-kinase [Alphaproteobacteria bacterium PA3]